MQNSSYEKYKASLHALFDGKIALPDHLKQQLDTSSTNAKEERTTRRLAGAHGQIPTDAEEALIKAISSGQDCTEDMLKSLADWLDIRASRNPKLLKTRLEELALTTSSVEMQQLCKGLIERVR